MADIDTSGFSSVPVEMLISLLPEWLAAQTGDDPANTMYRGVLEAFADAFARPVGLMRRTDGFFWLAPPARCFPRLIWTAQADPTKLAREDVQVYIDKDDLGTQVLMRAHSQSEFLFTHNAVYALSDDGTMFFRNLAFIAEGLYSENGIFQLNETLIPDEPVYIDVHGRWEEISSIDGIVDWDSSRVIFAEPGWLTVLYSSVEQAARIPNLPVYVDGEPSTLLVEHDAWNSFDEAALLVSLSRIQGEDNTSFAERIRTGYSLLRKSEEELSKSLLGHELGLVGLVPWTGDSDLELEDISDVTYVTVLDLDKTKRVTSEVLVPDAANKIYTSSAAAWDPGWMVFVNGTRVTEKTYSGIDSSDVEATGRVDFGEEVLGNVTADYSYPLYTTTIDTGHAVVAKTPNTAVGSYIVLYVRHLEAHSALDPELLSQLFDDDGNPTDLYMQITEAAAAASPILIGRTGWGDGAHWFDDTESTPPISYLPVPIK